MKLKVIYILGIAIFCFSLYALPVASQNAKSENSKSTHLQEKKSSNYDEMEMSVAPPPAPLLSFSLPVFSGTTADSEPHFYKIEVVLGYEKNAELSRELASRKEPIRQVVNIILHSKSYSDINSIEGTINLSDEIKAHLNVLLMSGKIKEIYFKEFVIN